MGVSRLRACHYILLALAASALAAAALFGCAPKLPDKPSVEAQKPAIKKSRPSSVSGKKVLLVHSYHPGYPWTASITQGVASALKGTGVRLEIFYMDTKRNTKESWMKHAGRLAMRKMEQYRPDVVITSDDNAQEYFAKRFVGEEMSFVFTGVDADPSKYGYPAPNVTGIIERPQLQASIDLLRRLRPVKRIAVLSSDDSTSIAALGFMREDPINAEVVEWKLAKDFDDWKAAIKRYNTSVDAIVIRSYQALKDPTSSGRVVPSVVGKWTAMNAHVPTIAFHDFEIRDGILIGVVKSGFEYGYMAGAYALRILRGSPPSELPIVRAKAGIKMINCSTAKRLGILPTHKSLRSVIKVP